MFKCCESELISSVSIKKENIKLGDINGVHKEGEVFRNIHSRMPFAVSYNFSKNFIRKILLVLMPIFVVKNKENKYACVGNIRSLHFARNSTLEKHNKIPVQVIDDNKNLVRHMVLIDVVVGPMLFTVGKKRKAVCENIECKINRLEGINITKGNKTAIADRNQKNPIIHRIIDIKIPKCDALSLIPVYKNNVKGIFTTDCIRLLVLMYPIYVGVLNKKEELVSNSFIFKICNESLLDDKNIPCNKNYNLDSAMIKNMFVLNSLLPVYVSLIWEKL